MNYLVDHSFRVTNGSERQMKCAFVEGFADLATIPEKTYESDAGFDVFSAEEWKTEFGEVHAYRTGVMVEIPEGYFGLLKEKSSQGVKGVAVKGGVIDAGFRGELRVPLSNSHRDAYEVKVGDPIAQLIIIPVHEVDEMELVEPNELSVTFRASKGFGEGTREKKKRGQAKRKSETAGATSEGAGTR